MLSVYPCVGAVLDRIIIFTKKRFVKLELVAKWLRHSAYVIVQLNSVEDIMKSPLRLQVRVLPSSSTYFYNPFPKVKHSEKTFIFLF